MFYDGVVVAGGSGKRAKLGYNKVFFRMENGKTVLENACQRFIDDEDCRKVVVVCNDELPFSNDKVVRVSGGAERYDSVLNGLKVCECEFVLIHDGARPFLEYGDLFALKEELKDCDGAILAMSAIDTIKVVEDGFIKETIDRRKVFMAATPQGFRREVLMKCFEECDLSGVTDDASLLEKCGIGVKVVECSRHNIKLTNVGDFECL